MTDKPTELTPEQEAKIPEYREKWIKKGLNTDRSNRARAEEAIKEMYRLAELDEPEITWELSPKAGAIAAMEYAKKESNGTLTPEEVRERGFAYIGGSLWAGWPAYCDFMNEVVGVEFPRCRITFAEEVGYAWCLAGRCIATEKPTKINLDDRGRLHSFTEKAIQYEDGYGVYSIYGIPVPEHFVTAPETITAADIDKEQNLELMRIMLEIFGYEKYIEGAEVLDEDIDSIGNPRQLLRKKLKGGEDLVMARVLNSSLEPDGTRKPYLLMVEQNLRPLINVKTGQYGEPQKLTVHNAVASTFGLRGEEYGLSGQMRQGDVFIRMINTKGSKNLPKFIET